MLFLTFLGSVAGMAALGAATLLACRRFGLWQAGLLALPLAVVAGLGLTPILAAAPLAGFLAGWQAERQRGYGKILAAASLPGAMQAGMLLLAPREPREELVAQVAGQLEATGLKLEEGYSVSQVVEMGLRLQPATEFLFVLFIVVLIYRLAQAGGVWLKVELPPAIPFRNWRPWDALIWVLIAGLVLLLGTEGIAAELGLNLFVATGALYALQGLALVRFSCWRLKVSGWLEVFLYLTLGFTAGLSVLLLAGLGLLDTWFDWRRLGIPSEKAAAGQDGQQHV
ncbi:MAG: DUF2232 domain-containing protein [Candidatus Handelsmanbacteria bacterium]|nr:DUF2232 domain-containing protein [Candidatus Handelsmanbacteria bacterium]